MRWSVCILLGLCLQSLIFYPKSDSIRLEDNGFYFKKGEHEQFFNNQFERFREIQLEFPGIIFEFSLVQLESESHNLAGKRYKTLIKSFQEAGLDMSRIVFESRAIYVKDFNNHLTGFPAETIDSVGAILEGKVLSVY